MQRAATAGTGLGIEIEVHLLALQMVGKARTIRPVRSRLLRSNDRQQLLGPSDVGSEVFQTQLQLITIEPLGPSSELQALQLLNDQPQALDLDLGL